jgi:transcriptional regulator of acetoin/glycerol metabolism
MRGGQPGRTQRSAFHRNVHGVGDAFHETSERAAVDASFGLIEAQHLPPQVRRHSDVTSEVRYRTDHAAEDERDAIVAALEHTDGALAKAAELLGMGRTTLWRKLKQYGLTHGAS